MNSQKRSGTEEVVDMELHCVTCGTRLYISTSQADAVMASLERCGAAILVCICGQAQLIRCKRQQQRYGHERQALSSLQAIDLGDVEGQTPQSDTDYLL